MTILTDTVEVHDGLYNENPYYDKTGLTCTDNKSVLFDGHSSYATPPLSLSVALASAADWTVEGWYKLPINYRGEDLVILEIGSALKIFIDGATGNTQIDTTNSQTVHNIQSLTNTTIYFVITMDINGLDYYFNAALSDIDGSTHLSTIVGTDIITIGSVVGNVDNIAFYDKVLSQDIIEKHYGVGRCAAVIDTMTFNSLEIFSTYNEVDVNTLTFSTMQLYSTNNTSAINTLQFNNIQLYGVA